MSNYMLGSSSAQSAEPLKTLHVEWLPDSLGRAESKFTALAAALILAFSGIFTGRAYAVLIIVAAVSVLLGPIYLPIWLGSQAIVGTIAVGAILTIAAILVRQTVD